MKVSVFVEGGGDSKELHVRCREGFSKLIGKAGFRGRMPRIVACGGRQHAFDMFLTAIDKGQYSHPILLVDSEDPVVMNPLMSRRAPGITSNPGMAGRVLTGQMMIRRK